VLSALEDRLRGLVDPIVDAEELELVSLELKKGGRRWLLRIYIDREGGVSHKHCEQISKLVGIALEVEELIPHGYILEVSSPGLDRPLTKREDFSRFKGRLARLVLQTPYQGAALLRGRLLQSEGETITIEHEGQPVSVDYKNIVRARLEVEFPKRAK